MTKKERIIIGITGSSHLTVHALMLVLPSLLLVFQKEFQVGLSTMGLVVNTGLFMFGLGAIPAGYLESRVGGRRLLLIYQLGTAGAALLIALSSSLLVLTVGVAFLGLLSSIYHPAGLTIISRRVKNISPALAYHGIAGTLGLAIGPTAAALFSDLISWRAAYGIFATVNLGLAVLTLLLIPPFNRQTNEDDPHLQIDTTNKPALFLYYLIMILLGLAFAGFTTYMPALFTLQTRLSLPFLSDTMRGGMVTTLVFISGIIGQLIGGYLGSHYRRSHLLMWILILNIPLLMALGFTTEYLLLLFSFILGMVHFSVQPVGNALIAQFTRSQDRGLGYGISFFLSFGVGSFAAGLGGYIAENYGVANIFPVMALILLPAVGLAYLLHRKT